eukprot:c2484_g1_i1 orf=144-461(+)
MLLQCNFEIMYVFPLGRGLFREQFRIATQADEILAQSLVDFHVGFFAKWSQGMGFIDLDSGLVVTARFPRLLPEYAHHVEDIGRCTGFLIGDRLEPRMQKNPPRF